MKKMRRMLPLLLLMLLLLPFVISADAEYSSADDPLVSLSYVNDVLAPEIVAQVMERVEAEYVKMSEISLASAGSYTVLTLTKGQTLMARSVCEVVVTDGTALTVVTSSANIAKGQGIVDLTAGNVAVNRTALPVNHYLVIPKADGRGFSVSSDTVSVLVRGDYYITG